MNRTGFNIAPVTKQRLTAWIASWAATFLACAFIAARGGSEAYPGGLFATTFDLADAIPPASKLLLGGLIATILFVGWRIPSSSTGRALVCLVSPPIAVATVWLAPIDFLSGETIGLLGILAGGVIGGLVCLATSKPWKTRRSA